MGRLYGSQAGKRFDRYNINFDPYYINQAIGQNLNLNTAGIGGKYTDTLSLSAPVDEGGITRGMGAEGTGFGHSNTHYEWEPTTEPPPPVEDEPPEKPDINSDLIEGFDWNKWITDRFGKWQGESKDWLADVREEFSPYFSDIEGVKDFYRKKAEEGIYGSDEIARLLGLTKQSLTGQANEVVKGAKSGFLKKHGSRLGSKSMFVDQMFNEKVRTPLMGQVGSQVAAQQAGLERENILSKDTANQRLLAAGAAETELRFKLSQLEKSEQDKFQAMEYEYAKFKDQLQQHAQLTLKELEQRGELYLYGLDVQMSEAQKDRVLKEVLTDRTLRHAWKMQQAQFAFNEKHADKGGGFFDIVKGVVDLATTVGSFIPGPWQAPSLAYQGIQGVGNMAGGGGRYDYNYGTPQSNQYGWSPGLY